jgi:hypothetical protein
MLTRIKADVGKMPGPLPTARREDRLPSSPLRRRARVAARGTRLQAPHMAAFEFNVVHVAEIR